MATSILLFRGINVGGRNILPMKDLSALLTDNGFTNVKTYIQSGNVVADHSGKVSTDRVGSLINERFGFTPDILRLGATDIAKALNNNPFPEMDGKTVNFLFCVGTPRPDTDRINRLKTDSESCVIKGKVCFLHAPDGLGRSKLASALEACLRTSATGRNLNTVKKLHAMVDMK